MPVEQEVSVAVIGGGPSGVAAAVQLSRSGIPSVLYEGRAVGGLVRNAWRIDNLPGASCLSGVEMAARLESELDRWGICVRREKVTSLSFCSQLDGFKLASTSGTQYYRRVIVASGTQSRPHPAEMHLGDGLQQLVAHEVSGWRDLAGLRVAIVGGGDAAFDYALTMSECNEVRIICRRQHPRALALLAREVAQRAAVSVDLAVELAAIEAGTQFPLRLCLQCQDRLSYWEADRLLVAVGREPAIGFINSELRLAQESLVRQGRLAWAGDVVNDRYRQLAIAIGGGIAAAMRMAFEEHEVNEH